MSSISIDITFDGSTICFLFLNDRCNSTCINKCVTKSVYLDLMMGQCLATV